MLWAFWTRGFLVAALHGGGRPAGEGGLRSAPVIEPPRVGKGSLISQVGGGSAVVNRLIGFVYVVDVAHQLTSWIWDWRLGDRGKVGGGRGPSSRDVVCGVVLPSRVTWTGKAPSS